MAQGLPQQRAATARDRDHVADQAVPDLRILLLVLSLFLMLMSLLASPLSAQSRARVQVAARVVSAEPSRQALVLAGQIGPRTRRSSLATVRVIRETPDRRLVSIDFLKN